MTKKLLIDASHAEETRVVVLDGNRLEDFDVETATRKQIKGNIYLAKVIRVEPSLQAAFVEYGGNRHGFLAFGEIHPDYYQIPVADRQRLLAMAAAAAEEEEAEAENGPAPDAVAPEPDVAEVAPEAEPSAAQPLEVTSIDIVSAPPPEPEEAEPVAAEFPEARHEEAVPDIAGETPPDAEPDATTEASQEAETPVRVSEEDADSNGEDSPSQPPPESLGGDGDDAAEARERRQRQRFLRNYKIQEVIHRRQIMLIQVVKEERGNKGAALTTYLSLAGRFSVLMPNSPTGGGVSRKITSVADRRRLKEAVSELDIPDGMGLIVRTAGANRPKPEIKRDCEYLLRLWDDIRERTLQSVAPALIYEEASLIKRTIRDVYTRDVDDVYVDGEEGFNAARDFMRMLMPSHAKKVQLWTEGQPLFAKYQVEAQLDAMLNPIVQLRSGGYIVINQTEALVAIDVNSGRSTRERSIEDTALRTNLEAAEETARQLRMRDLAGLIVIDFIDMESRKNNGAVERKLKDALKNDRARIQVGSISHFGLMEMSRQRLRPSLAEASLVTCPHCAGMGHVRSPESAALHILRAIEDEGSKFRSAEILVTLPPDVALYLFNHKRDRLSAIETRYAMRVIFSGDASLTAANFRIEKIKAQTGLLPAATPPAPAQISHGRVAEARPADRAPASARPAEPRPAEPVAAEAEEDDEGLDAAESAVGSTGPAGETAEEGERRRRRRRRRRGRRAEPGAAPDAAQAEGVGAAGEDAGSAAGDQAALDVAAAPEDQPTEMDLILAAELGEAAERPEAGAAKPDGEKPARRRRTRGGRRRSAGAEGEAGGEPAPVQSEIVYADIAELFEAAERAEAEQHMKTHLVVAPQTELELAADVHVPESVLEPVSHVIFEPVAEPWPAAPEPVAAEPAAAPEPAVKPVIIGAEPVLAEKKRGWWRR